MTTNEDKIKLLELKVQLLEQKLALLEIKQTISVPQPQPNWGNQQVPGYPTFLPIWC